MAQKSESLPVERMAPPESEQEARQRLAILVEYLSEVPNASAALRFAAQAVGDFLTGESKSLDNAFGIRQGRGRPKQPPGRHLALMLDIWEMREAGEMGGAHLTWPQICDKLGLDDPDHLAKIYARYRPHIVQAKAAELEAALNKLDGRLSPRARASRKAAKKMIAEINAAKDKEADIISGE